MINTPTIDNRIITLDNIICTNIDRISAEERGFLSQNILSQLRKLVEHVDLKIYFMDQGKELEINQDNFKQAEKHIAARKGTKFLNDFHNFLQISESHYITNDDSAERLMLKYYAYLIKIKALMKDYYNIEILRNIVKFPINQDKDLMKYYEKIVNQVESVKLDIQDKFIDGRYYIQKVKPIFINSKIYYELTLSTATDTINKFDRITVFSKFEVISNYSIKLSYVNRKVEIFNNKIDVKILTNWMVSIRPCEINNLGKIFSKSLKIQSGQTEYRELMKYLTESGHTLLDLATMDGAYYFRIKYDIHSRTRSQSIFELIDECRSIVNFNKAGSNIIRYLLYTMNNKIIKQQYIVNKNEKLCMLCLNNRSIPFDELPLISSLYRHNPRGSDLFECIDLNNREDELLYRYIQNNTEKNGILYTPIEEINNKEKLPELVNNINKKFILQHYFRKLVIEKDYVYIKSYEDDTIQILKKLQTYSIDGVKEYKNSVNSWLENDIYATAVDCDEKKNILKNMFENSKIAMIYGAAGTGKTTLINHISNFWSQQNKLFLANTHLAVENLKMKVNNTQNNDFQTIAKFLNDASLWKEYDLVVIDECSTVSNIDMKKLLNILNTKLLVLVGDIYQIDSITFGNWFKIAKSVMPKYAIHELTKAYRSRNKHLQEIWDKVRNCEDDILEYLTKYEYTTRLNESILKRECKDEIILCLNYDGLYGINNINRFLQNSNLNPAFEWGIGTYKVGDPILFNEFSKFSKILYNNLKGKILDIKKEDDKIWFTIEIDKVINEFDAFGYDFELLGMSENKKSIIRFKVNKFVDSDEDETISDSVVPFVVAYAVSIHKSQGLEYSSVKIIITKETEELISHNIFYTAITRARDNLKIYWSPESEKKIIGEIKKDFNERDTGIIKYKMTSK